MERWRALDAVKGVGLIAMTVTHSLAWFYIYPTNRLSEGAAQWFDVWFLIGGILIMSLVFAAGCSLRFSWRAYLHERTGHVVDPSWCLAFNVCRRSFALLVVATVINVVVWGWDTAWYWNILHFIALAQIVLYVLARIGGTSLVVAMATVSLSSSFWYQSMQSLGAQGWWGEIIFGDLSSPHIWPLLPWFYVPAFGFVLAGFWAGQKTLRALVATASCGALLLTIALAQGVLNMPLGYTFSQIWDYAIQPPLMFIVAATGMYLLLLSGLSVLDQYTSISRILAVLGRHITYIYATQLWVGFWFYVEFLNSTDRAPVYFWLGLLVQVVGFALVILLIPQLTSIYRRSLRRDR
jgi:uncharacterized membrane protein